jgi:hypothetical protein
MTPSTLARIALAALLAVLAFGCAGQLPDDGDDEPAPKVKQPPAPKDGSGTVAGCDGIPESGVCQDGVAVYCDLENAELRRKDCKALGKSCVVDGQRGAMCETVTGGGGGNSTCDTGVTFEGTCGGANGQTATWCDPGSNQTIVWNCAADGLSCQIDDCGFGAFCCGSAPPPPPSNECATLGFYGECSGNTARWCNGNQLVEKVCGNGQTCQLDACADGAYCCNAPQQPPQDECSQIGIRGVCTADGNPRWCSGGQIQEVTCATGRTCQIDVCGEGAFCC